MSVSWMISGRNYNSTSSTFTKNADGTYNVDNTLTLTLSKIDDGAMLWCHVSYRWDTLPRANFTLNLTCKMFNLVIISFIWINTIVNTY